MIEAGYWHCSAQETSASSAPSKLRLLATPPMLRGQCRDWRRRRDASRETDPAVAVGVVLEEVEVEVEVEEIRAAANLAQLAIYIRVSYL